MLGVNFVNELRGTCLCVLSQNWAGGTEEKHKRSQDSWPLNRGLNPRPPAYEVHSVCPLK